MFEIFQSPLWLDIPTSLCYDPWNVNRSLDIIPRPGPEKLPEGEPPFPSPVCWKQRTLGPHSLLGDTRAPESLCGRPPAKYPFCIIVGHRKSIPCVGHCLCYLIEAITSPTSASVFEWITRRQIQCISNNHAGTCYTSS